MYAVREEKVISGGLEFTKRTEVIGTNEGFVALETRTLETQQPQQPGPTFLPITAGPPVIIVESPPEPKPCCDYGCCECDDNFKWNSFAGKVFDQVLNESLFIMHSFKRVCTVN
ncbi:hypothetical protein AC249_AIPGENE3794 [Exaiptasia diaphana]|nr:hypothetical protein AC249_AIPGENE3794 [Exaiptasia diaphana]